MSLPGSYMETFARLHGEEQDVRSAPLQTTEHYSLRSWVTSHWYIPDKLSEQPGLFQALAKSKGVAAPAGEIEHGWKSSSVEPRAPFGQLELIGITQCKETVSL